MAMNDRMRASDADRERITGRLREHFAEGRLTREELDERVTAALNAKTLGDLRALMTDLPEPEPVLPQAAGLQRASAGPVVFARRGPRLLPLLLLLAFLAILSPGGGLVVLAVFQFVLVLALLAGAVALFAAARFRRRMRRHWARVDHPTWGYPL